MLDAILNLICSVIGIGVVIWTIVTIIKTDGLNKHKSDEDIDFP